MTFDSYPRYQPEQVTVVTYGAVTPLQPATPSVDQAVTFVQSPGPACLPDIAYGGHRESDRFNIHDKNSILGAKADLVAILLGEDVPEICPKTQHHEFGLLAQEALTIVETDPSKLPELLSPKTSRLDADVADFLRRLHVISPTDLT